jgi:hypothetical protein
MIKPIRHANGIQLPSRHGWGCNPNPELAITYLSYAASNSAQVESLALHAGMKKGGAAKGELVLAIFELANCFRNGWGIKKDPVAAKQYYETAANLGDTDAMNEVAWCYLEGFGCKKDKVSVFPCVMRDGALRIASKRVRCNRASIARSTISARLGCLCRYLNGLRQPHYSGSN